MKEENSGFTIIEIIMTLLILAGLLGFFYTKYPASLARARDTKRMNDLKTYQTGLEAYAAKHNLTYPASVSPTNPSDLCDDLGIPSNDCPIDPKGFTYQYVTDAGGVKYRLRAQLEKSYPYFVACSNGKSGYFVGDLNPSDGSCPTFINTTLPDIGIIPNSATGKSCKEYCINNGYSDCMSIGTDAATAINGKYLDAGFCGGKAGDCNVPMIAVASSCGVPVRSTYCKCT